MIGIYRINSGWINYHLKGGWLNDVIRVQRAAQLRLDSLIPSAQTQSNGCSREFNACIIIQYLCDVISPNLFQLK